MVIALFAITANHFKNFSNVILYGVQLLS